jgi:dihydropteroate synthase
VNEQTEWRRLEPALTIIRKEIPEVRLSIDTFRPEIAGRALEQFGNMIINDISGGNDAMYNIVRKNDATYIWTLRGDYELPSRHPEMHGIDIILDPGFGFIGSTERDYECMRGLEELKKYDFPILVGISRKSMIYKPLGLTPDTCLSATQALQLYALEHGATILRTHDVRETKQTIDVFQQIVNCKL